MSSKPLIRGSALTRLCVCCLIVTMGSGCASVLRGSRQAIPVNSDPPGADILIDGNYVGATPADVQMQRKRDHLVTVQLDGYQSRSVPVVKSIGGAVWGNILAGGFIGWGVDAATGAQYNLSPETIFVQLRRLEEGEREENDGSQVISRLNQLDDMKENDQITDEEYTLMRLALLEQHFPEIIEEAEAEAEAGPGAETDVAEDPWRSAQVAEASLVPPESLEPIRDVLVAEPDAKRKVLEAADIFVFYAEPRFDGFQLKASDDGLVVALED